jgi:hypothetical protein
MPIRFESPSLGGRSDSYLEATRWQADISYRRLRANEFFVGRDQHDELGPFGEPLDFKIHSFSISATYAVTDRYALSLNVPWSTGSVSRMYADGKSHTQSASGLGDIRLVGTRWIWDPVYIPRGNVALGLGLKAPTGTHNATDYNWIATGDSARTTLDQSVQLGDGGWGIILKADGFRRIDERSFVYASGEYLATTKEHTGVSSPRRPDQMVAVPDLYSVRAGASRVVSPKHGLTLSLGMRQDATTRADLLGGKDMSFRRPAMVGYIDPGLSLTSARGTFYVNTPIRAYQNFRQDYSYVAGERVLGGDLARYLVLTGFTRRW